MRDAAREAAHVALGHLPAVGHLLQGEHLDAARQRRSVGLESLQGKEGKALGSGAWACEAGSLLACSSRVSRGGCCYRKCREKLAVWHPRSRRLLLLLPVSGDLKLVVATALTRALLRKLTLV